MKKFTKITFLKTYNETSKNEKYEKISKKSRQQLTTPQARLLLAWIFKNSLL